MRRGDFLLTPGWNFHGHHNDTDEPMAWIDGLDIPFVHYADAGFFEFGTERVTDEATPDVSRSERLWAHPGLRPLVRPGRHHQLPHRGLPLGAHRRRAARAAAARGRGPPGHRVPGHAAVRYTNPTTGGDVMPTIRAEFHRLRAGATTEAVREVGSSVWQVFEGAGSVVLNGETRTLAKGDLFVVPSWAAVVAAGRTPSSTCSASPTPPSSNG